MAPAVTEQETAEPKESSEYVTLKEMLGNLTALLAGNAQIIIRINSQLLSHGLAYNAIANTCLTPFQRANQLITSLLALIKSHSNPNDVFSSLISVLQKVGLTLMANGLLEASM